MRRRNCSCVNLRIAQFLSIMYIVHFNMFFLNYTICTYQISYLHFFVFLCLLFRAHSWFKKNRSIFIWILFCWARARVIPIVIFVPIAKISVISVISDISDWPNCPIIEICSPESCLCSSPHCSSVGVASTHFPCCLDNDVVDEGKWSLLGLHYIRPPFFGKTQIF